MENPADGISPVLTAAPTDSVPTILYFNSFPPSNWNGGTVLIRRLLRGYPPEKLIALTLSANNFAKPDPGWCRRHVEFPSLKDWGSRGIWRFKGLINRLKGWTNWLMLPAAAFCAIRLIRKHSVSAILTVAAGTFFLPAVAAARWTKLPLVLIVHDDWVPIVAQAVSVPQWVFRRIFRAVLRRADHIFVISAGMQEKLKVEYGVDSEVQMPATEPWEPTLLPSPAERNHALRIFYSGNGWAAWDSLTLLIRLIREKTLRRYGIEDVELHLCAPWKIDADQNIIQHGWVSESEVRRLIASADVLFLPYSFETEYQAFTRTSFPAKAADYVASGKAILILGPEESTICRYAEQLRCAELVTELNEEALAQALSRLASAEDYRQNLASNAQRAFALNHNIFRQRERFIEVVKELVNHKSQTSLVP